jgi:hypothetical protein
VLSVAFGAGVVVAATEKRIDDVVPIENVQSSSDTVRGRVLNETDDALKDVRLLATDQFLWRNERHPGDDSPSTAHKLTVPGPVPPHGSLGFEFRRPSPLPDRPDGDFTTEVTAVEVTRQPITTGAGYERTYERRTYYGDPPKHDRDDHQ